MLRNAYKAGYQAAFERYKLGNLQAGAAAYNPVLNPGASAGGAGLATVGKSATPPAAPSASMAQKSNVLG